MRGMMWTALAGSMLLAALAVPGCGGDGSPPPPDLEVTGYVVNNMPGTLGNTASFVIRDEGAEVTDATVEVAVNSGTPAALSHMGAGVYYSLIPGITAGDDITLTVTWNSTQIVQVTMVMPEKPNVTAPTAGSTHDAAAAIDVVWDALSVIPDYVQLVVDGSYTQSGNDWTTVAVGSAVTASIPADTLKTATSDIELQVVSVNHESNLGANAEAGSYMQVAWYEDVININTQ